MEEKFMVGQVVTGTVSGLQKYGAFVALNDTTQGLIHISEITNGFVRDINDFIRVGDEVEVKILSIAPEDGKIALSMRETTATKDRNIRRTRNESFDKTYPVETGKGFAVLRDKLNEWIEQAK